VDEGIDVAYSSSATSTAETDSGLSIEAVTNDKNTQQAVKKVGAAEI